jgi:hypothetical protein
MARRPLSRSKIDAALRSILAKRPRSLTALTTIDRFETGTPVEGDDRGVVLVAVALVEQLLEDAILCRCVRQYEEQPLRDKLFGGTPESGGALTTFAAKITMGHALGLYGNHVRQDLDRLRKIRNVFAHAKTKLSFTSPAIKDALVFNLYDPALTKLGSAKRAKTPKGKFLGVAAISMIHLNLTRGGALRSRARPKVRRPHIYFDV